MDLNGIFDRDRITIAILALGGQGGGVLADWIIELANANGFVAQGTSVPGVAQRTGSTVYYVELLRRADAGANQPEPVLAMMPVPGDVDIVIASELMEAGRAILRGFVTTDRTTLIGSTHRVYAISEKSARGDGIASSDRILDAAGRRAARFIGFDMEDAATRSGAVISSIMFGALAGSGALPFTRDMFEGAIRHGGKAVETNLKGFASGHDQAQSRREAIEESIAPPVPTTDAGRALFAEMMARLPELVWPLATEGLRKLMDYQDAAYARLYIDRLAAVAELDAAGAGWRLSIEASRYLALWMAYEDIARVADLKVRATRDARVRGEVRVTSGQVLRVTEYMHPRLQEVCEMLPARAGRWILGSGCIKRALTGLFAKGRHVETTGLRWFLALRLVASLRSLRRSSLRYAIEQRRIESWLDAVREQTAVDLSLAEAIATLPRLLKGYGDTFERGLSRYEALLAAAMRLSGQPDAAERLSELRDLSLREDDAGCAVALEAIDRRELNRRLAQA